MLFLAHEMPFLSMKCIDNVTFQKEKKMTHYLKIFQFKFAPARTIIVDFRELQCPSLTNAFKIASPFVFGLGL